MKNSNRFYTYAYLREDRTPYYVGKGEGKRAYYKYNYEIKPPKDKSRIILLKQNLIEKDAFKHEKYMIDVFGRKDLGTGILRNKTDGGDGNSGAVRTEEWRKKHSEMMKGENNPQYGKKGKSHPSYGKKWWNDGNGNHKKSVECPGEGWVPGMSEEIRKKQSQSRKGENNHMYGKRGKNNPQYGKKWWNDENGNTKMSIECPGESWFPGRGKLPIKLKTAS